MEAAMRTLNNQIAMTTVTITAREQQDYTPPQAPTFTQRISQSWGNSLEALRRFGENVAVAAVGAAPWLAILFVLLVPPIWILRRLRRRRARPRSD